MTNKTPSWLKYELIRYRGFRVKYSAQTNSRASQVHIRDTWFNRAVFIPYGSSSPDSHNILEKARVFLASIGIEITGMVGSNNVYTILSTNFDILLNKPKEKKCPSSN